MSDCYGPIQTWSCVLEGKTVWDFFWPVAGIASVAVLWMVVLWQVKLTIYQILNAMESGSRNAEECSCGRSMAQMSLPLSPTQSGIDNSAGDGEISSSSCASNSTPQSSTNVGDNWPAWFVFIAGSAFAIASMWIIWGVVL